MYFTSDVLSITACRMWRVTANIFNRNMHTVSSDLSSIFGLGVNKQLYFVLPFTAFVSALPFLYNKIIGIIHTTRVMKLLAGS
jgi:hypothetical protein